MKKLIIITAFLIPFFSYAGVHVQNGDPITVSSVTIGASGIRFNDGTTQTTAGGGGTPSGSNTQVQFNSSGSFGASSNFTFNGSTLTVTGVIVASSGIVVGNGTDVSVATFREGTAPSNPDANNHSLYFDSGNSNQLTSKNSSGVTKVYVSSTSNVATATALAANGTNCSSGQAPLGVDASGNVEGCFTPSGGGGGADASGYGSCFVSYGCSMVAPTSRAATITAMTNKTVAMTQIVIPYKIKLARYVSYVVSGVSTNSVTMGIYNDNNGVPGSQVSGSTFTKVNLNSLYITGVWGTGNATLDPGVYWFAFAQEGTSAQYHYDSGPYGTTHEYLGYANTPKTVTCSNLATGGGSTLELPSTCDTPAQLNTYGVFMPIVLATSN